MLEPARRCSVRYRGVVAHQLEYVLGAIALVIIATMTWCARYSGDANDSPPDHSRLSP
ncbi:MAG: hypothetical protein R3E01_28910 [Pirellulaceae bacterium]